MTVRIDPLPETAVPPAPDEGGLGALSTGRGNLPLDSVDVRASIAGLAAGIEVEQGFRNPYDEPLEATYIFPLPARAAVTALRMEAADRVIDGVLKERGQARQDYDTAIAAGRRAAIAEEDRPDVFTMRVGNILPGERVTVRLTLNQPLPYEDGAATFRFPLVVAPRYVPGAPLDGEQAGAGVRADTDAAPDASRISPPVLLPGFPDPVRLSIAVDVDPAGLELAGIQSALHVVTEDTGDAGDTGDTAGGRTSIRLHPGERLNRDFILRLAYASPDAPALAVTPDTEGDEGTFTLTVLPSGESRPAPRDVVLILDRSGSMHGWKMVAARRAAGRIVDTLTGADRFAVLSFDNVVERPRDLGYGLAEGTDRNRFRAVEHLAGLGARGGTEMLAPLEEACGLLADPGRDRVLVLITDGQIANEDQILARLRPRLEGVRVHTVGIDRAVNAGFLHRLAEAGNGRCELVESEDRLDEAMEAVHHRIGSPLVTGLRLAAAGLEIVPDTVAPRRIGALYPGVPLVVSGRYRGAPSGGITVRGSAGGTGWERHATATRADSPAAGAVWARAHLRDLEDRYATGGPADLERRIIDTSLRFGVLCRFTAFVAVDGRVVAEGGRPHQVVQPVEAPDGWGAAPAFGAAPAAMPMAVRAAAPAPPGYGGPPPAPMGRAAYDAADDLDVPDFLAGGTDLAQSAPPPPPAAPAPQGGSARGAARTGGPGRPGGPPRLRRPEPASEDKAREALRDLLQDLRAGRLGRHRDRTDFLTAAALPALAEALRSLESAGGADPVALAPLRALARELQELRDRIDPAIARPAGEADAVWERAIQTLAAFLGDAPAPEQPRGTTRRAFWKRS
ncbi:VIT domain-containing protein [Actinomadura sp. 21ATH]|uniref:VIT domain-containing protein n=1 Tax=Actinomadura sp. 21ATH TaxID=1735444 RepID=UPI0035BF4E69